MTVRNMKTLNPDVDKAELLALLLDVLMAAEAKMTSGEPEAECEFIHALDLTADALTRVAEAKRQMFEGVSSAHPYDILQQQIRLLRLRNRARGLAPTASNGPDREFPYAE